MSESKYKESLSKFHNYLEGKNLPFRIIATGIVLMKTLCTKNKLSNKMLYVFMRDYFIFMTVTKMSQGKGKEIKAERESLNDAATGVADAFSEKGDYDFNALINDMEISKYFSPVYFEENAPELNAIILLIATIGQTGTTMKKYNEGNDKDYKNDVQEINMLLMNNSFGAFKDLLDSAGSSTEDFYSDFTEELENSELMDEEVEVMDYYLKTGDGKEDFKLYDYMEEVFRKSS